MTTHPLRRFLGVEENASPEDILGLPLGRTDRLAVETALRERLELVYRHPDGRSDEAEYARRCLREAATLLITAGRNATGGAAAAGVPGAPVHPRRRRAATRPSAAPPVRPANTGAVLTEFDRNVLAVLVACGGWNAASRARLVSLAGSYGVTASGLVKIVTGLSDYARSGGQRFAVTDITSGAGRMAPGVGAAASSAVPGAVTAALGDWRAPYEAEHDFWHTVKMAALFGLITVLAGVIVVISVVRDDRPAPLAGGDAPPVIGATGGGRRGSAGRPGGEVDPDAPRVARFRPLPTFLGNALPPGATDAADECPRLPQELDLITRKLSIEKKQPSEAVYRSWAASLDTIAVGWVLVDDSTRAAVDRAIRDVLFESADAPSVGDRLLQSLTPARGRLAEPSDVWRGAWRAGTLGAISESRTLPPSVVEQARRQLTIAVGEEAASGRVDFTSMASAWLEQSLDGLTDLLEIDDRAYDYWEMWLAATRELGDADQRNASMMSAVARILATDTDLVRPGPSINVVGRLLTLADFEKSAVVKDRTRRLFEGDDEIAEHDLWVLTSLLAQLDTAPWFTTVLVLPPDADKAFRNRIRDRVSASWPPVHDASAERALAQGRGIPIEPADAVRWRSIVELSAAQRRFVNHEILMEQLLVACRINECAALLASRKSGEANDLMDGLAAFLGAETAPGGAATPGAGGSGGGGAGAGGTGGGPGGGQVSPPGAPAGPPNSIRRSPPGAPRPGQVVGRDGEWAERYGAVRRNTSDKMDLLQMLRTRAGTDLGPLDAEALVREVYRGSPQEVRSLARSILVDQFTIGPNVALELVDQFPDLPQNDSSSDLVSRYTGRLLPGPRSASWPAEARLALVQHALALRRDGHSPIDALADEIGVCFLTRLVLLTRATRPPPDATADEAARLLANAWQDRARASIATVAAPDDLAGLARRHAMRKRLTDGPIQGMVAEQLSVLEYLTYVTVAEQPGVRAAAIEVLEDSARHRRDRPHVIQQSIAVERAITAIWALRMSVTPAPRSARALAKSPREDHP